MKRVVVGLAGGALFAMGLGLLTFAPIGDHVAANEGAGLFVLGYLVMVGCVATLIWEREDKGCER